MAGRWCRDRAGIEHGEPPGELVTRSHFDTTFVEPAVLRRVPCRRRRLRTTMRDGRVDGRSRSTGVLGRRREWSSVRSATAGSSRAVLAMRQADDEPGTPQIRFASQVAMDEWKPVVPLLRGAVVTAAVLRLAGGCAGAVLSLLAFTGCGNPTTESALLLENVTVIDGTGAPAQAGMSVVVAGERIAAVGAVDMCVRSFHPAPKPSMHPAGFLIPGLWDMHVHLGGLDRGTRAGPSFIAHGVTGVRDMASPLDEILTLRDRWRTASPSGPRLFCRRTDPAGTAAVRVAAHPERRYPGGGWDRRRRSASSRCRLHQGRRYRAAGCVPSRGRPGTAARPSRCGPPSCRYERRRGGARRATEYRAFRQCPLSRPAVGVVVRRRPAHPPRPAVAGCSSPG